MVLTEVREEAQVEHPGCVTRYGAARRTPPLGEGGAPLRRPHGGRTPDELPLTLARAVLSAVESPGGYAGGVYLRSGTPGLLRMAVLAGLPGPLMRPWWRMHVNRPFPVAEAYRSGRPVYLADAEEAMRRFPQLMAGLPFPFGSLYAPVLCGGEKAGVLVVLRHATPGEPVGAADRRELRDVARRLGTALADLETAGTRVRWDDDPVPLQLPADSAQPVRTGRFVWDLADGAVTADEELCEILGAGPTDSPRTIGALAGLLAPEDAYGLLALAHRAAVPGNTAMRRMRLLGPDGRPYLLEFGDGGGDRLSGVVLDLGSVPVVTEAADRLAQGILTLDRLGRITYVNRRAEQLLARARPELAGRVLWEVLPWFGLPAYEDHYRAALICDEPVHFLARRTPREWLSVSLYPGPGGVTATLASTGRPAYTPGSVAEPGAGLGSPADRSAALYRPVALAIALTEAVTARQVSAVVTEELLPAFGGRQLAIYLQHEQHLYLAWETGFPRGFLDRSDSMPASPAWKRSPPAAPSSSSRCRAWPPRIPVSRWKRTSEPGPSSP